MRALVAVGTFAVVLAGCDPYERRSGEYFAGAVDPAAFPAAYLGDIRARAASAHGVAAPYYAFALSAAQAGAADPLAVGGDGSAVAAPLAYVFDPRPTDPFPAVQRCVPPAGYVYDAQRDGYRLDEQGDVFTALPKSGYAPIVAEVPVTSNGEACQSIKSAATLAGAGDVVTGAPDGRLLAWAIIDPGADVGPQKIGWFDHYLLTYLDGGYVPTSRDASGVHMVAQNVYFPTPGALGGGHDVLDAVRGEPGYSPLCRVLSFVPADPANPPTDAKEIDPATLHDTGTFVWCLQP